MAYSDWVVSATTEYFFPLSDTGTPFSAPMSLSWSAYSSTVAMATTTATPTIVGIPFIGGGAYESSMKWTKAADLDSCGVIPNSWYYDSSASVIYTNTMAYPGNPSVYSNGSLKIYKNGWITHKTSIPSSYIFEFYYLAENTSTSVTQFQIYFGGTSTTFNNAEGYNVIPTWSWPYQNGSGPYHVTILCNNGNIHIYNVTTSGSSSVTKTATSGYFTIYCPNTNVIIDNITVRSINS